MIRTTDHNSAAIVVSIRKLIYHDANERISTVFHQGADSYGHPSSCLSRGNGVLQLALWKMEPGASSTLRAPGFAATESVSGAPSCQAGPRRPSWRKAREPEGRQALPFRPNRRPPACTRRGRFWDFRPPWKTPPSSYPCPLDVLADLVYREPHRSEVGFALKLSRRGNRDLAHRSRRWPKSGSPARKPFSP